MSVPRIGSLFSGYGGMDMAVQAVIGGRVVWHSDVKPASIALLRHRHPDAPNLGDIATADFRGLEHVDVLTAGWPCQPHSSAGKRLGEVDPRALWPHVARAVAALRPAVFFGENVARITSNGELRRVVRSLASLGYVGAWRVLRASGIGACHQRARCFVVAVDPAADTLGSGLGTHLDDVPAGQPDAVRGAGLTLLPTPTARNARGPDNRGPRSDGGGCGVDLQTAVTLLPTPSASSYGNNRGGAAGRVGPVRESLDAMARSGRFEGALLPTPTRRDADHGAGWGDLPGRPLSEALHRVTASWGAYAEAVARWKCVLDREAPEPTQISARTGKPQLSPGFVEWMMGLPRGWVCDVPNLAPRPAGHRSAALSLLGDGVVPQQGATAFRWLLDHLGQRLAVAS